MVVIWNFLAVALGGALGAMARYGLNLLAHRYLVSPSWGTLVANVVGCLGIGLAFRLIVIGGHVPGSAAAPAEAWRLFIITGLLGAMTTFSTFSLETIQLAQQGRWGSAAFNVAASLLIGFFAVLVGLTLGFTSSLPNPPGAG